jgi:RNA polymerase sigma-70 factor (ECF subfamily)
MVRAWQQPVARFLTAMIGRTDIVPDLCQEVFLRVFLARAGYRETGAFPAWVYRIARNVAHDALRREHARLKPLTNQTLSTTTDTPDAPCEQQELAQAVARALAELPAALRDVIVLRHYEGMSFPEIGKLLGVPASTLRSRFEVGLARLRSRLREQGWSP